MRIVQDASVGGVLVAKEREVDQYWIQLRVFFFGSMQSIVVWQEDECCEGALAMWSQYCVVYRNTEMKLLIVSI
jgi:hypothetical protein